MSERPSDPANGQPDKNSQGAWVPEYVGTYLGTWQAWVAPLRPSMQGWQALIGTAHLQPTSLGQAQGSQRRGWEKTDEPWRAWSFWDAPLSCSLPRFAFPWPASIQAFIQPSNDRGDISTSHFR